MRPFGAPQLLELFCADYCFIYAAINNHCCYAVPTRRRLGSFLKKSMWQERPAPAEYMRAEKRTFLPVLREATGDASATISAAFFNGLLECAGLPALVVAARS